MAQVENFKGKLGFEHRSEEKLALALTELRDTLEEFGHPALQVNAQDTHRIGLECDDYQVTLRLRRIPLRLGVRTPPGIPAPAAYIELVLTPRFATGCDTEISEILLAMILRRLTEALNPLVIFWRDTNKALTCKEFLGAFQPLSPVKTQALAASVAKGAPPVLPQNLSPYLLPKQALTVCPDIEKAQQSPDKSSPENSVPHKAATQKPWTAETLIAERPSAKNTGPRRSKATARLTMADKARAVAEADRSRGQKRFGSVEDASPVLEQHCDEIQMFPPCHRPGQNRVGQNRYLAPHKRQTDTTYQSIFGKSRFGRLRAIPRVLLSATANAVRGVDLVFSVRALITAMVVLFLHGSGMVQAAARVLMP